MNNMGPLADMLTASGGTEPAGFLNDLVAQLWPNINVAGCNMAKNIVEPILASTLPGPLANLRFVKIDLGNVPMRFSEVDTHKTSSGGIQLEMDVIWESKSDIELDGSMVPKIGIERVHVKGRLSVLLAPLTNVIPCIGAAQVAFINPPKIDLDFTDAANIADLGVVSGTIRKTILGVVGGMAVLPNRFLVKLDNSSDWFKTYQPHLGVVRLTIERAIGIAGPKKKGAKRLLQKIVKDVPDCYCKVNVGAEEEWRTSTKKNDHDPEWNETHDFLVADFDQDITLDVQDDDLDADDDIGFGSISIKDILLDGGSKEIALSHKGEKTGAHVTVHAKFFHLVSEPAALTASESQGEGQLSGLATVLVASAGGLQGNRDELSPSVKVKWGAKEFRTAIKTYSPGTDIFNPSFDQAFRIPITMGMINSAASFKISLLNKESETGAVEIPFEDVLNGQDAGVAGDYDVGNGATVRVSVSLKGLQLAK
ncbi:C2 domain-containing protein [Bimuria novae-zelandiae CBS 107.79]|uniref:C2 domain-containing protein n=1 Tax=Bimuria novae-zelandiae CBS 107.79 TaxID=1447943 RepID=A0A6A5VUV9_9PLEO|nr:C2 domain-containing protein [Bimuria novae-zelandiae CBS 107.79]